MAQLWPFLQSEHLRSCRHKSLQTSFFCIHDTFGWLFGARILEGFGIYTEGLSGDKCLCLRLAHTWSSTLKSWQLLAGNGSRKMWQTTQQCTTAFSTQRSWTFTFDSSCYFQSPITKMFSGKHWTCCSSDNRPDTMVGFLQNLLNHVIVHVF